MNIAIGSDHGGYLLKEKIKKHLLDEKIFVMDFGCTSLDSCNYAEYAIKVAEAVASKQADLGIIVCTSGEGVCIAANKVKGVRCGIGYNDEVSSLLRVHNDANVITFGAKYMAENDVIRRVDIFINSKFEEGRHQVRVDYIKDYEKKN